MRKWKASLLSHGSISTSLYPPTLCLSLWLEGVSPPSTSLSPLLLCPSWGKAASMAVYQTLRRGRRRGREAGRKRRREAERKEGGRKEEERRREREEGGGKGGRRGIMKHVSLSAILYHLFILTCGKRRKKRRKKISVVRR